MTYSREKISYMVGTRIRDYRIERKMSQENLALTSGIHPDFLGRLERGERCPSIDTLYKICMGLKISITQLLDFEADIHPSSEEARHRIDAALSELTEDEAVQVAEIVEKIVRMHKPPMDGL
ncbi:MAG: helix-turn-helix transcriptional regulator [Oscillospiraceae bacterium]|nr:helix-turn-helix transcriptional regulator [Oscillospiraceae bacterium]